MKRSSDDAIYLDWNATTPTHPDVIVTMTAVMATAWANPSSVHGYGRRARAHVEDAREAVAALVGKDPRDVVLTGGGTEANNIALLQVLSDPTVTPKNAPGVVISRMEHPSLTRVADHLAAVGVSVTWVEPTREGLVSPEAVVEALERARRVGPVGVVVLQAVNHETGVVQPVEAVADVVHACGALLHVDAVQAVGRLAPEVWAGADTLSVAAHKFRGPKGIGALVVRPRLRLRQVLFGGAQERGLRPGTQDPAACAGFAVACTRAHSGPARYVAVGTLRDRLEAELIRVGTDCGTVPIRNGEGARAPHVLNMSWPGWRGEELCAALDLEGVAVSSGSACSAGTAEPSPVLTAMVGRERAASAVRVSLGEETTEADITETVARWARVAERC